MAIFDWNRNGKADTFDTLMDYHLFKEMERKSGKKEASDEEKDTNDK